MTRHKGDDASTLSTSWSKKWRLKKLGKLLSAAPKLETLLSIYSIRQIQGGRDGARGFLPDIPDEAIACRTDSRYHLYSWLLETLANEVLAAEWRPKISGARTRTLNPRSFAALRLIYNTLHAAENASDGPALRRVDVLVQMGRLTKRQFEWQRKLATTTRLDLFHSIYRTDESIAYFEAKYGISFDAAMLSCFIIYSQLLAKSTIKVDFDASAIGLQRGDIQKTLGIIAIPLEDAIATTRLLRAGFDHIGYAPSVLRRHPVITFTEDGQHYAMSPLPDLIFYRMTEGLFYDFAGAPSSMRNQFAERFENYIRHILSVDPTKRITGDVKYGKTGQKTPDVLVSDAKAQKKVIAAFEIKARKQSATVRFAEDPTTEAGEAFEEIGKGIYQLWRYLTDSNSEIIPAEAQAGDDPVLAVFTLDNWVEMGHGVREHLHEIANNFADKSSVAIPHKFRPDVPIFSYHELDYVVARSDVDSLLECIRLSKTQEYHGWLLTSIFGKIFPNKTKVSPKIPSSQVVPWWKNIDRRGRPGAVREQSEVG